MHLCNSISLCLYISNLTMIGLIVQKFFVFHRKCIESVLGFWGILGVKTVVVICINSKRHFLAQNTRFDVLLAQIGLRLWLGAWSREAKNGVRRPSWIFIFVIFHHMAHFSASIRVYMSNFMTIGLTVQKLLAFTFSIGNALKVPKIGVLGDFRGENRNIYLSNPRKAPPWPKTRVLRYYSSKSVYGFD